MKDRRNSSFGHRGAFACGCCGRGTRQVRGLGNENCCPECYELAGIENAIFDGSDGKEYKDFAIQLWNAAIKKGGNVEMMKQNNSDELLTLIGQKEG